MVASEILRLCQGRKHCSCAADTHTHTHSDLTASHFVNTQVLYTSFCMPLAIVTPHTCCLRRCQPSSESLLLRLLRLYCIFGTSEIVTIPHKELQPTSAWLSHYPRTSSASHSPRSAPSFQFFCRRTAHFFKFAAISATVWQRSAPTAGVTSGIQGLVFMLLNQSDSTMRPQTSATVAAGGEVGVGEGGNICLLKT